MSRRRLWKPPLWMRVLVLVICYLAIAVCVTVARDAFPVNAVVALAMIAVGAGMMYIGAEFWSVSA